MERSWRREVASGGRSCAVLHTNAPSLNSDGIFDGRSLRHRLQPHDARIFTSWCSDHLPAPLTLAPPPPPQDASAANAVAETATAEIAIAYAAEFINWVPLTAASASAIAPKAAPSTLPSPRPSPPPSSPSALKAASHGLHLCRLRHHHPIHPHHRSSGATKATTNATATATAFAAPAFAAIASAFVSAAIPTARSNQRHDHRHRHRLESFRPSPPP